VKKILIVSQYFWPENFRVNELASELSKNGNTIEVLTSLPNYPSGKIFKEFAEDPENFNNFKGIKIHRVHQILRGTNRLSLAFNYISFVLSASFYLLFKLPKKEYDLIFGVQLSPIFSMIPAILFKKIIKKPLHMWVLDIWPDSINTIGIKSGLIINLLKNVSARIYTSADMLFLSSDSFKKNFLEIGIPSRKLVYLPQWIEAEFYNEVDVQSLEHKTVKRLLSIYANKTIFTFTGNIGESQDFPAILKAIKNSKNLKNLVLLVIGEGRYREELNKNILAEGLENHIVHLGQFPISYMPVFYKYSDFLLVSLKDISVFSNTLPGKVQSYMSSGKPIVCMANGETQKVINNAKCGYVANSGDYNKLSRIFDLCCSTDIEERYQLGLNGKNFAYKNFRIEPLIKKIEMYIP
jgi:colanic acid biosynthesis glycosyl transferase WcaI